MDYLPDVIIAAKKAADVLSKHFYNGFSHDITVKSDRSPVTQADIASNKIITESLQKIDNSIPVLSEENAIPDFSTRARWTRYWLIDPLDGTRGFIKRSADFCINIALIENHAPILGVIYAPIDQLYCYAAHNLGAFFCDEKNHAKQKITVSKKNPQKLHLLSGHFDDNQQRTKYFASHFGRVKITQLNSALKFMMIARGLADVYVRFGATSEWDTAAGQCMVTEAGGAVVDFQGKPLQYNAKSSLINPSFIAMGDVSELEKYVDVFRNIKELP